MDVRTLIETQEKSLSNWTVEPEQHASDALNILAKKGANAVLVVKDSVLKGVITKHDFVERFLIKGEAMTDKTRALHLMSPNPTTISPSCSLEKALKVFTKNRYHCLPVVENQRLLGFISLEEVVDAIIHAHDSLLGYSLDQQPTPHLQLADDAEDSIYASLVDKVTNLTQDFYGDLVGQVKSELEQIKMIYEEGPLNLSHLKILFCGESSKSLRITRMALQSTGGTIDYAETVDKGEKYIYEGNYQIVILDKRMIKLSAIARDKNPNTKIVLLTAESPDEYIPRLAPYPYVNNIVSLSKSDYKFTLKGVLSTIKKITTGDIFGIEKYLESGTKIYKETIEGSDHRLSAIDHMKDYFRDVGLTKALTTRISMVAEELLLNAIYDAPVDQDGEALYNTLDRRVAVKLRPEQMAHFTYGCDGSYVGVAAIDPFGSIKKNTVFKYLESCYSDQAGSVDTTKGGAGRGLYMIVEGADLVVFNVRPGFRTEVAAFFAIDRHEAKRIGRSSFHYFVDAA
ncbi:CBS domain-containing protein [Pseudobacteriovorax antillogorgiicola]|uniref:CBS domain-containing protein n=1 Tax=Pseudobacteriovorax antillogorgiicola TaxID=1513793 RepID=A0A1Y6C569_9BACT|nr:CBS domain-containing protein [Pseudobacteriovorax antillogorgiicola]TCS51240.1 CBS domain protein [Pseudobacteriovorax antillogorgiicola]SMF36785.1 CBS domain-containing protein [Pseudobacteriovorax antillogorgiicola]